MTNANVTIIDVMNESKNMPDTKPIIYINTPSTSPTKGKYVWFYEILHQIQYLYLLVS